MAADYAFFQTGSLIGQYGDGGDFAARSRGGGGGYQFDSASGNIANADDFFHPLLPSVQNGHQFGHVHRRSTPDADHRVRFELTDWFQQGFKAFDRRFRHYLVGDQEVFSPVLAQPVDNRLNLLQYRPVDQHKNTVVVG